MKLKSAICSATLAMSLGLGIGATVGDDKSNADPTGTWRVVNGSINKTQPRFEYTLIFNMNAGTLTGTLTNIGTVTPSRFYQWEIKEAKFEGNEVSFTVTHPFDVGRGVIVWSYKGTITANSIRGKVTKEALGERHAVDWSAERINE
jgi:hypothetical protein